jgi:hypothetical protein
MFRASTWQTRTVYHDVGKDFREKPSTLRTYGTLGHLVLPGLPTCCTYGTTAEQLLSEHVSRRGGFVKFTFLASLQCLPQGTMRQLYISHFSATSPAADVAPTLATSPAGDVAPTLPFSATYRRDCLRWKYFYGEVRCFGPQAGLINFEVMH